MRINNNRPYPIHETSNVIQFRPKSQITQEIKEPEPMKLTKNEKIGLAVMTLAVTGMWVLIFLL